MSEIKGQLLGILLVIGIFGIVATALMGVFSNLTEKVSSEANSIPTKITLPAAATQTQELLHY